MTPEKKLELARLQVELAKAQRAYGKDRSYENRERMLSIQREEARVRLGPAVPKKSTVATPRHEPSAMKLTPREPEQKKSPKFTAPVHRPDVKFDDSIGQWVGV